MQKINSKLIISVIVGMVIIVLIPGCIDTMILGNDISSNLSNAEWGGFLGSYIGSIISVIGAFAAIKFQLLENDKSEKEKKINNIRNVIEKILKLNLEVIKENKYEFTLINDLDLNRKIIKIKEKAKLLYEFPKDFFENNINSIIDMEENQSDFLKKVYSVVSKIEDFNEDYNTRTDLINQRNRLVKEKINFSKENKKNIIIIEIIEKIGDITRKYNHCLLVFYNQRDARNGFSKILKNRLKELSELYDKCISRDPSETTPKFFMVDFFNVLKYVDDDLNFLTEQQKIELNTELGKIYLEAVLELFESTKEECEENIFLEYYCREMKILGKVTIIKQEIEELMTIL